MVSTTPIDIKGDAPSGDAFWSPSQLQLWQAAEAGDKAAVQQLLEEDEAFATKANRMGWTALHRAAMGGSAECIPLLLAVPACAALLEATDRSGCTPLHIACGLGHAAAVRALLTAGASATATTAELRTPMHFACQGLATADEPNGHTIVILMLLTAGGMLEAADCKGVLAIQLARPDQLRALQARIFEHGQRAARSGVEA